MASTHLENIDLKIGNNPITNPNTVEIIIASKYPTKFNLIEYHVLPSKLNCVNNSKKALTTATGDGNTVSGILLYVTTICQISSIVTNPQKTKIVCFFPVK